MNLVWLGSELQSLGPAETELRQRSGRVLRPNSCWQGDSEVFKLRESYLEAGPVRGLGIAETSWGRKVDKIPKRRIDSLKRNGLCMNGAASGSSVCSRSDPMNWKRVTEVEVAVIMEMVSSPPSLGPRAPTL